ncbi:MAG: hypothetical protein JWQ90_5456 [Hydrocarboniphaga sp.]|uniref:hypothetical protein n=1 Tax=Hydrocarboniphaga sp. TaxID=2033016 RepID=UPI00262A78D0|nr:hypothetical protein [Hydrocarboniphaga sp.]MDB5973006.1 hypothetical protein [Hydrocarboniphaga sp.]
MKKVVALRSASSIAMLVIAAAAVPGAYAAGSVQARQQAAASVAGGSPECKALGDFYWEIGDASGVQGSGKIGSEYSANETIRIASASKFVFGAYFLEKIGRSAQPTADQLSYLEMRSGYANFNPLMCMLSRSVDSCMTARSNGDRDGSKVGRFSYGGGHDQKLAGMLGLGRMNAEEFGREIKQYVGPEIGFSYKSPQPAGGMESSPADYGKFLRKIISGQLRMKEFLGYQPVCASTSCPGVAYTPVVDNWHYSINHWIEDDPRTGDGAFSSPGAMGFYPWISKDKTTYGVLARNKMGKTSYWDSVLCGREIRKAWMSGG